LSKKWVQELAWLMIFLPVPSVTVKFVEWTGKCK